MSGGCALRDCRAGSLQNFGGSAQSHPPPPQFRERPALIFPTAGVKPPWKVVKQIKTISLQSTQSERGSLRNLGGAPRHYLVERNWSRHNSERAAAPPQRSSFPISGPLSSWSAHCPSAHTSADAFSKEFKCRGQCHYIFGGPEYQKGWLGKASKSPSHGIFPLGGGVGYSDKEMSSLPSPVSSFVVTIVNFSKSRNSPSVEENQQCLSHTF